MVGPGAVLAPHGAPRVSTPPTAPAVAAVPTPGPVAAGPVGARGEGGYLAKIARGAFFNLIGSIVSAVATFGFAVVVTRTTNSQVEAGIFFSLSSVFVIAVAVSRLGVPMGLVYFLARHRTTGDQHLIRALVRQAVLVVTAVAVVLGVVGLVSAGPLADAFLGTREHGAVGLVRVLSLCIAFAALTDVGVGATRGLGVMRPMVLIDRIARPVAQVLLALLLALAGVHSALGVGLAWVLPWVPASLALLLWTRQLRRSAEQRSGRAAEGGLEPGQFQAFWRFTAPRSASSIAQLALQRADIILIAALKGPREAAIYTAATRFLVFGQLLSNSIGQTIQPKLAQLMVKDDRAGARQVYQVATVWLVLSSWPIYLLSAVFAEQLLRIFGRGYRTGAAVIIVLSLVSLVATASGTVDVVLGMAGRASWTMINSFGALTVDLVLNALLIPRIGIIGAALAWAAAIAINNLAPLTQLAVSMRLHPFGRASATAFAVCALCFGAVPLLLRVALGNSLPVALLAAVLGTVGYLALVWRFRLLFELRVPRRQPRRAAPG